MRGFSLRLGRIESVAELAVPAAERARLERLGTVSFARCTDASLVGLMQEAEGLADCAPAEIGSLPEGTDAAAVYNIVPEESAARYRVQEELARFHAGIKRLVNPHIYPVGLERGLHERKTALVLAARGTEG